MQFLERDTGVIHYHLEGPAGAPVVMFANSLGTDFRMWDAVAAQLRDHYRILRYDKRGHGLSSAPPGPYTIRELAEDAIALLDGLGLDRVHFCGLSIGGMIGQQLGGSHGDRLHSVILCDTAMTMPDPSMWSERAAQVRANGLEPLVDGAMERWFTPGCLGSTMVAGVRNMFLRTPREGYASCCEAIGSMNLEPQVASIRAPTLVVVGAEDQGTPVAASEAIAGRIDGAQLEIIPNAAHLPPVEQPDATVAVLRRFLDAQ